MRQTLSNNYNRILNGKIASYQSDAKLGRAILFGGGLAATVALMAAGGAIVVAPALAAVAMPTAGTVAAGGIAISTFGKLLERFSSKKELQAQYELQGTKNENRNSFINAGIDKLMKTSALEGQVDGKAPGVLPDLDSWRAKKADDAAQLVSTGTLKVS
ncbi:hypothetical protein ACKF11_12830 [Methylobacillus sp. Pita2]